MLTVDRTQFVAWCDGVLLSFHLEKARGCIVNEEECRAADEALQRGESVLLRNGAELTGTALVLREGKLEEIKT